MAPSPLTPPFRQVYREAMLLTARSRRLLDQRKMQMPLLFNFPESVNVSEYLL